MKKFNFLKRNIKKEKGFTLAESLVAIAVLLIAISAPFTSANNGIKASRISQDQIVAHYLAQDAIEYVRNIRDSNKLVGADQLVNFEECKLVSSSDVGCQIDTLEDDPADAIGTYNSSQPIKNNNGLYGYDTGPNTKFTREVRASYIVEVGDANPGMFSNSSTDNAYVEVIIEWDRIGGDSEEYKIKTYFKNW